MKKYLLMVTISTVVAIAWGIFTRGELAFGGEMILPVLVMLYLIYREGEHE